MRRADTRGEMRKNNTEAWLVVFYIGNIIDTISTLLLRCGDFVEINILIAPLLNYPLLFVLIKVGIATIVTIRIYACRKSRHAYTASLIAAIIYGGISVYYVVIAALLWIGV